jgi:hypothetical protein
MCDDNFSTSAPLIFAHKVSRAAIERDEERRNQYQALIADYPPETHVYLDESACNRHTSNRGYAWAPTGDRARRHDYFVRGTRSVLTNVYWTFSKFKYIVLQILHSSRNIPGWGSPS